MSSKLASSLQSSTGNGKEAESRTIKTPIAGFKVIESHVRSFIIANFTPPNAKVLDLVCGPGGLEMSKWARAKISYLYTIDFSEQNLADAKSRWESKQKPFLADFRKFDAYRDNLREILDPSNIFDVVCSFHGLPQSFAAEETAVCFLQNVSNYLKPGGIFFGTMPDSAALWTCYLHLHQELRNAQVNRDEARVSNRGSVFFNVEIPTWDNAKVLEPFGSEFEITIVGEEDREHHTLVHFPSLLRIARGFGLELLDVIAYSSWYEEQSHGPVRSELQHLYGIASSSSKNPAELQKNEREFKEKLKPQLELCGLYVYFIFRKV